MENRTKELVTIAMGISIMFVGGFVVYGLLKFYPVPGFKYAIMGPLTGMFLYIVQSMLNTKYSLLKITLPFSIIMGIINIFMLLILVPAAIFGEVIVIGVKDLKLKQSISTIVFTFTATTAAIFIAKYGLSVIPMNVNNFILLAFSTLSLVLSVLSITLGDFYINKLKGVM